ncbi:MAG: DUF4352 domain-containing protein [Candidatus Peribacteraceae bacterium]|nr:DUF4352 domain-containing protein [Candidatus Peribacteraceae bacterium]
MDFRSFLFVFMICAVVVSSGCVTGNVVSTSDPANMPDVLNLELGQSAKTSELAVTVLSAVKRDYYTYYSSILKEDIVEEVSPGKVFVFVDVEMKNIGENKVYAGGSLLSLKDSESFRHEPAVLYMGNDKLPLFNEMFPGENIKGKILFEISEDSEELKVIHDFSGFIGPVKLASWNIPEMKIDEINTRKSVVMKINGVDAQWVGGSSGGFITGIDFILTNTGDVPITPTFDITITTDGQIIYDEEKISSFFYGSLESGKTISDSISLHITSLPHGAYDIVTNLKDGKNPKILAGDTITVKM